MTLYESSRLEVRNATPSGLDDDIGVSGVDGVTEENACWWNQFFLNYTNYNAMIFSLELRMMWIDTCLKARLLFGRSEFLYKKRCFLERPIPTVSAMKSAPQ